MKSGVITGTNEITVKEIPVPEVLTDTALVKVSYGGLCGPTDQAIVKGMHPRAKFPLIPCHEFSGEIVEIKSTNENFKPKDRVVINPLIFCNRCEVCKEGNKYICENLKLIGIDCDGGFAEYCLVPVGNLVRIPDELPLNIAALAEPMAVGVHAVKEAALQPGHTALIYGAGPIGLFVAEACRYSGASNVTLVDIDEKRLTLAKSLGFSVENNSSGSNECNTNKFDFVFETTGSEKVLKDALNNVKIKRTVVIVGKFDFDAPFDLHTVLFKEITVKGVRVYRESEFLTAVEILAKDPVRYENFISDYFSISQINEVFETFRERRNLARIMVSCE